MSIPLRMDERMTQDEPYSELRSEKEYEKWSGLMGQLDRLQDAGASKLTSSMKKLLLRTGWLNRRVAFDRDLKVPSIIGAQRALKFRFLKHMARSLKDLQYLRFAAHNGTVTNRTWFDESDFEKVLTKDDVLEIVRMSLALVSAAKRAEYANAILRELYSLYAVEGQEIQIVKRLGPWATHELLGLR